MIDPPKRTGYRLTYAAECLYNDWQEIGGCSCHTGCAPCTSCCSEGNPISLEENDEAWELDEEEEDMSRSCITDKGSGMQPPKSQFKVGDKVRIVSNSNNHRQPIGKIVTLCEITDRSMVSTEFASLGKPWGIEESRTTILREQDIDLAQPAKKDFVVGKWYKYTSRDFTVFKAGMYYKLFKVSGGLLFSEDMYNYVHRELFDINSELDYDPNTAQPVGYTAYVVFKQDYFDGYGTKEYAYKCSREDYTQYREYRAFDEDVFAEVSVSGVEKKVKVLRIEAKVDPIATKSIVRILPKGLAIEKKTSRINNIVQVTINRDDFFTKETLDYPTTKEENIMSNQNRVVSVKFFDDDAGLKAEHSLVAEYQVTTRVSDQMTISKVLLTEDVAGDIKMHNEVRAATVDLHILKQTGNKVMLQPIEFEDLRVEVRQV